jgi:hypothetical protein
MLGGRSLSRFFSVFGKKRSVAKKRVARSRRRIFFEALEARRVFAADMELFSLELENGEFRNTESFDAARIATAERVASFVEGELGIDLDSVAEATLTGKMMASDAIRSPVFTFELDGMEWDIRDRRGTLEIIDNDTDLLQNEESPLDANGNGSVDPLDVLSVINYINSSPTMVAPSRASSEMSEDFVDVNGDNVVSPMDVLMIINQLNSGSDETKMPLIAEDDYFERTLPATATEFPASEIDVLANDLGEGLQLVDVQSGNVGTVEIVEASDGSGKMVVRYTPGDQFRNIDAFLYTVEDAAGNRATAIVRVGYNLEATGDTSFKVNGADQVTGDAPGAAIDFQDADGNALISLEYGGDENEKVGVLVNFQPNEAPFGVPVAGTFSSDTTLENRFFPLLNGAAWITGTLAEVNEILAGLRFTPAPGFSAPEGIGANVFAFLYGSLGVSTQFSSDVISVVVPKLSAAPLANGDFFTFDRPSEPVRLNVLANDSSPSGSALRLVGVSQYPDVDELSITTPFGTLIEIDSDTNEIILSPGFGAYESFVYIVSDAEGRLSQGKVAVSLIDFGA